MAGLTELDLSDQALIGSIPPSLAKLTNLRRLYLLGNKLTGELPPEIIALCSSNYYKRYLYPMDGKRLDEVRCKLSGTFTLPSDLSAVVTTFEAYATARKDFCCSDADW